MEHSYGAFQDSLDAVLAAVALRVHGSVGRITDRKRVSERHAGLRQAAYHEVERKPGQLPLI